MSSKQPGDSTESQEWRRMWSEKERRETSRNDSSQLPATTCAPAAVNTTTTTPSTATSSAGVATTSAAASSASPGTSHADPSAQLGEKLLTTADLSLESLIALHEQTLSALTAVPPTQYTITIINDVTRQLQEMRRQLAERQRNADTPGSSHSRPQSSAAATTSSSAPAPVISPPAPVQFSAPPPTQHRQPEPVQLAQLGGAASRSVQRQQQQAREEKEKKPKKEKKLKKEKSASIESRSPERPVHRSYTDKEKEEHDRRLKKMLEDDAKLYEQQVKDGRRKRRRSPTPDNVPSTGDARSYVDRSCDKNSQRGFYKRHYDATSQFDTHPYYRKKNSNEKLRTRCRSPSGVRRRDADRPSGSGYSDRWGRRDRSRSPVRRSRSRSPVRRKQSRISPRRERRSRSRSQTRSSQQSRTHRGRSTNSSGPPSGPGVHCSRSPSTSDDSVRTAARKSREYQRAVQQAAAERRNRSPTPMNNAAAEDDREQAAEELSAQPPLCAQPQVLPAPVEAPVQQAQPVPVEQPAPPMVVAESAVESDQQQQVPAQQDDDVVIIEPQQVETVSKQQGDSKDEESGVSGRAADGELLGPTPAPAQQCEATAVTVHVSVPPVVQQTTPTQTISTHIPIMTRRQETQTPTIATTEQTTQTTHSTAAHIFPQQIAFPHFNVPYTLNQANRAAHDLAGQDGNLYGRLLLAQFMEFGTEIQRMLNHIYDTNSVATNGPYELPPLAHTREPHRVSTSTRGHRASSVEVQQQISPPAYYVEVPLSAEESAAAEAYKAMPAAGDTAPTTSRRERKTTPVNEDKEQQPAKKNKRAAKTPPPVETVAATKKKKKAEQEPSSTGSGQSKTSGRRPHSAAAVIESDALVKAIEASKVSSRPGASAGKPNSKTGSVGTPSSSKGKDKLLESEAEPTSSKAPSNTESQGDFVSPPKPQPSNAPPPIRKAARMGARPKQP